VSGRAGAAANNGIFGGISDFDLSSSRMPDSNQDANSSGQTNPFGPGKINENGNDDWDDDSPKTKPYQKPLAN